MNFSFFQQWKENFQPFYLPYSKIRNENDEDRIAIINCIFYFYLDRWHGRIDKTLQERMDSVHRQCRR